MKIIVIVALLVSGCANTSSIRIVEYGGGGMVGAFTGEVGGCSVYQSKDSEIFASVDVHYTGQKCDVVVGVPQPPQR